MRRLTALLLLLLSTALSALAAPPMLDLHPSLTDYFDLGHWQAVTVTVTNPDSSSAVNGEVQVVLSEPRTEYTYAVYTRPVNLPAGAGSTSVTLTVKIPRSVPPNVNVYLVNGQNGNGDIVTRRDFSKIPFRRSAALLLAVSGQPDALQYLNGQTLGVEIKGGTLQKFIPQKTPQNISKYNQRTEPPAFSVANLPTPQFLPDNMTAYEPVNIIYLGPDVIPDAISDRQVEALRQWVASGGFLVVGRTESTESRLRGDERFRTWIPLVTTGGSKQGETRKFGTGTVCSLGCDPIVMPSPAAGIAFWTRLLQGGIGTPQIAHFALDNYGGDMDIGGATEYAPGTATPGTAYIAGFLLLYIVLLIPVNYLLLKRFKKREWAWATVPALVVLFSVGAYGFGYSTKGTRLLCNTASVIEMGAGTGEATVSGSIGIFSPVRARYRVALNLPDALFETADASYYSRQSGEEALTIAENPTATEVRNADIPMWSMRSFGVVTHSLKLGGGIEANLKKVGSPSHWERIVGTITNHTGHTLNKVVVFTGDIGQEIATLAPEQTVQIAIERNKPKYVPVLGVGSTRAYQIVSDRTARSDEQTRQLIRADIVAAFGDNTREELLLSGWIDAPLLPVTVDGKTATHGVHTNLLLVHLTPRP